MIKLHRLASARDDGTLAERLGVTPLTASLLVQRGYGDPEAAERFLCGSDLEADPFLLPDIESAQERIERAIEASEGICVVGDYDADGVTAAAMMVAYLEGCGAAPAVHIPTREEGYGLSAALIDKLGAEGVTLVVTVDNGISAIAEVDYAAARGIDVIVTDHHLPGPELPRAVAVIDPHRADCPLPFKDFSGAGVALLLIIALEGGESTLVLDNFADLCAIGTIGDIMPLVGDNRVIVRAGLQKMRQGEHLGIAALARECGIDCEKITAPQVAFSLVPRLNAAGRVDNPLTAYELLARADEDPGDIPERLSALNAERSRIEGEMLQSAIDQIEADRSFHLDAVLVLSDDSWHHGVIGIVASRLAERYARPCVLIATGGGEGRGSGRSREGFHLRGALAACADLFIRYGGHAAAAGFSIARENIPLLRLRINAHARELGLSLVPAALQCSAELQGNEFTPEFLQELELLGPHGAGNPLPLWRLSGVLVDDVTPLASGRFCKLRLRAPRGFLHAPWFAMRFDHCPFQKGDRVDAVLSAERGEYQGNPTANLKIVDIRPAGADEGQIVAEMALYERAAGGAAGDYSAHSPTRADVAAVFRAVRSRGELPADPVALSCAALHGIRYFAAAAALQMLIEAGVLELSAVPQGGQTVRAAKTQGKADLSTTPLGQLLGNLVS